MAELFEKFSEERTEAATSYRREEFRKQGTVAVSKELLSVVMLLSLGLVLYFGSGRFLVEFTHLSEKFFKFTRIEDITKSSVVDLTQGIFRSWGWMVYPMLTVAVVMAIVVCGAQVGFYVTTEPLTPNWERLNPVAGFQRLFSANGSVEAIKAVLKLGLVGLVLWFFLKGQLPRVGMFYEKTIPEIASLTLSIVGKLFFSVLATLSSLAILDYGFQRFQLEKQMKMTKREAKEEFKLREGDPLIKSRIKSIQRRIASRRMMEQVPKADVVVTNPTHLAVALKYDSQSMGAPKVTAKGAGLVAEKIKEIARFHRVPIIENKPLARTLFKELEINQFIPRELYKAVAEVLAYVYRLKGVNRAAYG